MSIIEPHPMSIIEPSNSAVRSLPSLMRLRGLLLRVSCRTNDGCRLSFPHQPLRISPSTHQVVLIPGLTVADHCERCRWGRIDVWTGIVTSPRAAAVALA
eukprot:866260-Prymnesium_polylepis.1